MSFSSNLLAQDNFDQWNTTLTEIIKKSEENPSYFYKQFKKHVGFDKNTIDKIIVDCILDRIEFNIHFNERLERFKILYKILYTIGFKPYQRFNDSTLNFLNSKTHPNTPQNLAEVYDNAIDAPLMLIQVLYDEIEILYRNFFNKLTKNYFSIIITPLIDLSKQDKPLFCSDEKYFDLEYKELFWFRLNQNKKPCITYLQNELFQQEAKMGKFIFHENFRSTLISILEEYFDITIFINFFKEIEETEKTEETKTFFHDSNKS